MSPDLWAGIVTALVILFLLSVRPLLLLYAERHRWRREHRNG
jgi:hypothetical protein